MSKDENKRKGNSEDDPIETVSSNKKAKIKEDKVQSPERTKYYAVPGVAYELRLTFGEGTKELPDNVDELQKYVGEYDVIFYESDKDYIEDYDDDAWGENVQRTTIGEAKLAMQSWKGKSVLRGAFRLADKTIAHQDQALSFIETESVIDNEELLEKYFDYCEGRVDGPVLMGRGWDMETEWYEEDYIEAPNHEWDGENCFLTCTMKVVTKAKAFPLSTDKIHGIEFSPPQPPPQASMEEYKNRHKKSWMVKHLNIPAEIASLILSYSSPPPFFNLEKGDILLNIMETRRIEWYKKVVLRKKK